MEFLRHILFAYSFLGIFVAGGLFFSKKKVGHIFLSFYLLALSLDQLNFLFESSSLVDAYPSYFLWIYPMCMLFGPLLWWHFKSVQEENTTWTWKQLIHLLPFLLVILIGLLPLYSLSGVERVAFARAHFMDYLMPINYIRTTHVVLYGLVMIYFVVRDKLHKQGTRGIYLTTIAIVYLCTACLQSYLTAFAESYGHFVVFYVLASSIVLISGIILYGYPQVLERLQKKYFGTHLSSADTRRISEKLKSLQKQQDFFLNSRLNLTTLSDDLNEKPHHISQVLSEKMKTSFAKYVNEQRVAFAKALLLKPEHAHTKIFTIALDSGFNNTVTFNKAFTQFVGMTPGAYRKNGKN